MKRIVLSIFALAMSLPLGGCLATLQLDDLDVSFQDGHRGHHGRQRVQVRVVGHYRPAEERVIIVPPTSRHQPFGNPPTYGGEEYNSAYQRARLDEFRRQEYERQQLAREAGELDGRRDAQRYRY